MFEPDSRYYELETKKMKKGDREITYKARRFLPRGEKKQIITEVSVGQGDRLDQITSRSLGLPTLFWRICDANNAMNPAELTDKPGETLKIPIPEK